MDQHKRRRGDRRDGVLLRELDSLHYITGIIYPNRCDNEAYVSLRIDLTAMNEYLARKNETEGRLRRIDTMEAHWGEIDALLAALPSSESIMALLRSLESPCLPAEIGVDGKLLKNTFLYCKEVRARYTILQLVWDLGLLDSLSDQVIAGLGA